jgi:hypothetical protein
MLTIINLFFVYFVIILDEIISEMLSLLFILTINTVKSTLRLT